MRRAARGRSCRTRCVCASLCVSVCVGASVRVCVCARAVAYTCVFVCACQARGEYMSHDAPVMALACDKPSEMLASGSANGKIKVWRISSGVCLKKFLSAHTVRADLRAGAGV